MASLALTHQLSHRIKRVEILSACQTRLGVQVSDVERLSRTQTVGEVIECLVAEMSAGAAPAATPTAPPSATAAAVPVAARSVSARAPAAASIDAAKTIILEEVSEATGYSVEMIDEEMSLEEELGIDS